jgi:hypothetical protein
LAKGAVCNLGKGGNRASAERTRTSKIQKLQISLKLDVCHLFVFDFDNPTVAKVFYQAAGEGEAGIPDTSI